METAAIYVRRSAIDDREGDNRSLGAQERECRTWAEREGLEVGPVYREAVGTSASRSSKKGRPENERPFVMFPIGHPLPGLQVPDLRRKSLSDVFVEVDSRGDGSTVR